MSDDEFIEDIKDKASKTPNIPRETIMKLIKAYIVSSGRKKQRIGEKLSKIVNRAYNRHALKSKNPVLPFPPKSQSDKPGVTFGITYAGDQALYPTVVPLEATREGILVTARSGHGKTRLIYSVVGSLINLGLNFVIWDIKDDHMELARIYSCVFVVNWNDLKFNPLTNAPKGMKIEMWWRKVWEIFCHSFGILIASSSYILEKLEELYEERKGTVMFNDLYQFLKSASEQSKRRDEYLSVAENRIYTVNQALGDVLNCKYGFEVSEIFSQKIVIRLRGLDNSMQGFLVQILLMHEFYSRMYGRVRL